MKGSSLKTLYSINSLGLPQHQL